VLLHVIACERPYHCTHERRRGRRRGNERDAHIASCTRHGRAASARDDTVAGDSASPACRLLLSPPVRERWAVKIADAINGENESVDHKRRAGTISATNGVQKKEPS
jgi:hypothetical protein